MKKEKKREQLKEKTRQIILSQAEWFGPFDIYLQVGDWDIIRQVLQELDEESLLKDDGYCGFFMKVVQK